MADIKAVKSVQRALRKVDRTHAEFISAKSDEDVLATHEAFEKAKQAYGRAQKKASDS
jgi:hypothetical protein